MYYIPPKFNFAVAIQKRKICNHLVTADRLVKRTTMGKRLRFFFAMFSTSDFKGCGWALPLMSIFNFQLLPATTSTRVRVIHVGGPCTEKDMSRCLHHYVQLGCPTLIYQHSTLVGVLPPWYQHTVIISTAVPIQMSRSL